MWQLIPRGTLIALVLAAHADAKSPGALVIRDARIVTASGPEIPKGTVVVRGGLIEAVGPAVAAPADGWVLEGAGLTVYPGFINALSNWGLPAESGPAAVRPFTTRPPVARGPEDRPGTFTWLRSADLFRADERTFDQARALGFTTAVVFPHAGIFAGEGAVVNLGGENPGQSVISPAAGQYLTLRTYAPAGFPNSLMGVIGYIRQLLLDAAQYKLANAAFAQGASGHSRPPYDRELEGLLNSPRLLLPASREVEISRMLRLASEMKIKPVLYGGSESFDAAGILAGSHAPILINLRWPERARDDDPERDESLRELKVRDLAPSGPAILARSGVPFAFYADSFERFPDIARAMRKALQAGLSEQDAVRALTLNAARIYGLDDRLGSIEKGKIANLTVTDGKLFEEATKVKFVVIDGEKFEPAPPAPSPAKEGNR